MQQELENRVYSPALKASCILRSLASLGARGN
jgi:hypothetical protein